MAEGRYYWLKLKRDFFDRRDIQLIEEKPNGPAMVLFYLKLMTESIDHEGQLRFNEKRPYTKKELAIITRTDIETVKQALILFKKMNLIECDEQKTLILPKVENMIGSAADNNNAKRQQRYRDRQKQLENQGHNEGVTKNNENKRTELEKEIDIDNIKSNQIISLLNGEEKNPIVENSVENPPSIHEVQDYIISTGRQVNVNHIWQTTKGMTEYNGQPVYNWKGLVDHWYETEQSVPYSF